MMLIWWAGESLLGGRAPSRWAGKLPNELGLYDMTGNIREWTWPDRGIPSNPDDSNEILHVRGGSWTTDREQSVLSFDRLVWVYQWNPIGFRLARNADSSDVD
jgi:sulfatase modifying factor 1